MNAKNFNAFQKIFERVSNLILSNIYEINILSYKLKHKFKEISSRVNKFDKIIND